MFKYLFSLVVINFILPLASAHEGHIDTPGTITPPKGGIVRTLETIHLELLPRSEQVQLFIYDLELNPLPTKKYPVSANAKRPRKKAEPVKLMKKESHWEFAYDAKGSHRYTFELTIQQGGHADKVKWNIEPKKKSRRSR